jgi:hypothetical protein
MSLFSRIPLPVRCFFAADLLVGALYVTNLAAGKPWQKMNQFLDLDHEGNLPAWFSAVQWAAVAGLFAFAGFQGKRRKHPASVALLLLAAVFLFFSMDEAASVHERLTAGLNGKLLGQNRILMSSWLVVLGVPVAVLLWRLGVRIKSTFDTAPGSLQLYLLGIAVFGAGAFLTESTLGLAGASRIPPGFIFVEEMLEMLGVTCLLWSGFCLASAENLMAFLAEPELVEQPRKAA